MLVVIIGPRVVRGSFCSRTESCDEMFFERSYVQQHRVNGGLVGRVDILVGYCVGTSTELERASYTQKVNHITLKVYSSDGKVQI